MTDGNALIVGASHAGAQLAASLRQEGWTGKVVLLGNESALPYQRPPLSKAYLAGKTTLDDLAIRSAEFYVKQEIDLVDATVRSIDPTAKNLALSTGEILSYDKLALCTGARPRRLRAQGAELPGVFYLRSAADIESIREAASTARRVCIVGGGYIGLETAASLRALGLHVTVLEATERVLERVTAPEVSAFFSRIHVEAGVEIRTQARVQSLIGDNRVREVGLMTGEVVPADLVIIGIGVEPNVELAMTADLLIDDGVVIDNRAWTSNPHIVAAGDCTSHVMARYGRRIRLESVPSAGEQAKVAAATLCGKVKEIQALPWFWSDQYDLKLQIAGLNFGYDEVFLSGDPTRDRDFTCFFFREGQLIAADCVNRPRDFAFSKRAIAQHLIVNRSDLLSVATA